MASPGREIRQRPCSPSLTYSWRSTSPSEKRWLPCPQLLCIQGLTLFVSHSDISLVHVSVS